MIDTNSNNKDIKRLYYQWYRIMRSVDFVKQCNKERAWSNLQQQLRFRRVRRIGRRIGSAAAVVICISLLCFHFYHVGEHSTPLDHIANSGNYQALLVLDDGEQINLSLQNGDLHGKDTLIEISNHDKKLVYKSDKDKSSDLKYNRLIIPRGGWYRVELSDGTRIWMNSDSQLLYPEVFGEKREVELWGEAYFEVARDSARPFIVKMQEKCTVEVLGTCFNISAYADAPVYATLVEGKVKVAKDTSQVILHPSEQAIISQGDCIEVKKVDTSLYISWLNGEYRFKNTRLEDIVGQLSRWYDVDFRFENNVLKDKRIAGIIYRYENLDFAIRVLERVANVDFIWKDDIMYVKQKEK